MRVRSAVELIGLLETSGIPGLIARVVEINRPVPNPINPKTLKDIKRYSHFHWEQDGSLRVWEQWRIGSGKIISPKKISELLENTQKTTTTGVKVFI